MALSLSERCSTCRALRSESFSSNIDIPPDGLLVTTIGKPPRTRKHSRVATHLSCELCRFFHTLAPSYRRRHELHVRLFDHISCPSWREPRVKSSITKTPFLSVLRKNSRLRYDEDIMDEVIQNGLCVYSATYGLHDMSVRRIGLAVDFNLINAQLRLCIDTHENCRRSLQSAANSMPILLIDCQACVVVERTLEEQYLTLSYVWGPKTGLPENKSMVNNQFSEAPLTIRDAMSVVRQLGHKYLWVDRFCIDQDDTSNRAKMIANMDLIYECALATVVALHGDNDQAGLPGISTTPRSPQMCIECDSGLLISSCPPLATVIENSKWNTRGWTYQEARLSHRCLFFSSTQVYLACRECTWSEAKPFAPSSSSIANLLNSARLDGGLFGRKVINHIISRDRLMYTQRELTFPHDALNAFRGILRRSQYVTFWGVPVALKESRTNPNDTFAMGLLWVKRPDWMRSPHLEIRSIDLAHRPGFPTWSWTSLATEIHQDGHGDQSLYGQYLQGNTNDFPYNKAQIEVSLHIEKSFESLKDIMCRPQPALLPETSAQLLIKGQFVTLRRRTQDEYTWYDVAGSWRYFRPDSRMTQTDRPEPPDLSGIEELEDALVLIQWEDANKPNKTRFVLMLLDWIDDFRAERRGLLTEYRDELSAGWVNNLPRVFKNFILQ